VLVVSDHTTDPDFGRAELHQEFERARDRTHTRNHPPGAIVDLLARLGLGRIGLIEVSFTLDFDEWFDRGTPSEPKEAVRTRLRAAPPMRGFQPRPLDDGSVRIDCWQAIVRGVKEEMTRHEASAGGTVRRVIPPLTANRAAPRGSRERPS